MEQQLPDIVVVGHIAQDVQTDGSLRLGGTVTYAALLAAQHGLHVGVVTSGTPREAAAFGVLVPTASVICIPAATPTIFENRYQGDHREQILLARAAPLTAVAIPPAWYAAPIVLLGPIADEIAPEVAACFTGAIRVATPQGWLRGWDAAGRVYPIPWRAADALVSHLTALVLSVEDLAIAAGEVAADALIATWAARVPCVVLTDGPRPAHVWWHGVGPQSVPAFGVAASDPTGAGDTFTTAFAIAWWRTHDIAYAIRYGHAAASFVVQAPCFTGMPTPAAITSLLLAHP